MKKSKLWARFKNRRLCVWSSILMMPRKSLHQPWARLSRARSAAGWNSTWSLAHGMEVKSVVSSRRPNWHSLNSRLICATLKSSKKWRSVQRTPQNASDWAQKNWRWTRPNSRTWAILNRFRGSKSKATAWTQSCSHKDRAPSSKSNRCRLIPFPAAHKSTRWRAFLERTLCDLSLTEPHLLQVYSSI